MKMFIDYILNHKIAPKDFKCSYCGEVVKVGRIYAKTNNGRFCPTCEDKGRVPQPVACQ